MKVNGKHLLTAVTTASLLIFSITAWAGDLLITGPIRGSRTYDSPEGIVFDKATLMTGSDLRAVSTYQVMLRPGTRIQTGAKLTVAIKDMDGLPNRWELSQCQTLAHGPADDPDADELSMASELQAGTGPCNPDTDGDGLPDGWEVQHDHDPLVADSSGDPDGDGLSDLEEYQAGTDMNDFDTDDDGMPDGWEVAYGLDPLADDAAGDADNDGYSNIFEYQLGSAPNDANSKPAVYLFNYDDNGNLIDMTQP